ncbi:MAG: hydroxysqualene dehydroxylase HpnE [Pseudomonadota bacterium]
MARLAVIGAGWAGLAAAVQAVQAGHAVTLFEAARTAGGRARTVQAQLPSGEAIALDNGQHILIGAYRQTLSLMQTVGVQPAQVLHAMPLALRDTQGRGLALPAWPPPFDAAWGIATARGWHAGDKLSLLRASLRWRATGFRAPPGQTVAQMCEGLSTRVRRELIEPLCVSALNTPAERACGQVFLRVLHDSLFGRGWGGWGASWLLLPRVPLGALFPVAALAWLAERGAALRTGVRVRQLISQPGAWSVDGESSGQLFNESFDQVLLAVPATEAARLVPDVGAGWVHDAQSLRHEAITTVYMTGGPRLPQPLLTLPNGPGAPAQFVFDRSQLGGPPGLLAFVISASEGDRATLESAVLAQANALGWHGLQALLTVVEKRATFACTPALRRPGIAIAPGLWACGDYVEGPYPATLEGAVMSAQQVVAAIRSEDRTAR